MKNGETFSGLFRRNVKLEAFDSFGLFGLNGVSNVNQDYCQVDSLAKLEKANSIINLTLQIEL